MSARPIRTCANSAPSNLSLICLVTISASGSSGMSIPREMRDSELNLSRLASAFSVLTKLLHLLDCRMKIRERHGTWAARYRESQRVRIGHVVHATEIGDDDRNRPSHSSPATDHDLVIRRLLLDPGHGPIQRDD